MLKRVFRSVKHRSLVLAIATLAAAGAADAAQAAAQGGHGRMMMGRGHMADMQLIHRLLAAGDKIHRTVTMRADGIETVTESDDPAIVQTIQAHVTSMYQRLTEHQPLHQHDPLFRAIFEHASQITFAHELLPDGIKVIETSTDPYVVKLIQAHARVLDLFIKNGHAEAMKNHAVPPRD